jgi:hypothetical protein
MVSHQVAPSWTLIFHLQNIESRHHFSRYISGSRRPAMPQLAPVFATILDLTLFSRETLSLFWCDMGI